MREKELFIALCSFNDADETEIASLIEEGNATPSVLGALFVNRMASVAYGVLNETRQLGRVDREFRNSLRDAWLISVERNKSYFECLRLVSEILRSIGAPYALLKGAYLCSWYPEGYRTSNDIDVMIKPGDVTLFSAALKNAGFEQGYIKGGKFVPATRQEIISSKMTRGETVPFIKRVDLPFMKYLEVDLNFSLDYKNSDTCVLNYMLDNSVVLPVKDFNIKTLDKLSFILHLCAHLYKEATTLPWIKMKRDMTLYKYLDIYALLNTLNSKEEESLIALAEKYNMVLEFCYCIKSVLALFPARSEELEHYLSEHNCEALDIVIAPEEKKTYRYAESDPKKRFFNSNRASLLVEVDI